MADPVAGAEHAAGGAGAFVQKRVGPLPLWAWAAGAGVALIALKAIGRKPSGVTGAGVATTAGAPSVFTPGAASGAGTFTAPTSSVPAPIVNVIIPGFSQPNAIVGTPGAGKPSQPGDFAGGPAVKTAPAAIVTTPKVSAPSSDVGSTPSGGAPGQAIWTIGGINYGINEHGDAPFVGAPVVATPTAAVPGSNLGGYMGTGMGAAALRNENA